MNGFIESVEKSTGVTSSSPGLRMKASQHHNNFKEKAIVKSSGIYVAKVKINVCQANLY